MVINLRFRERERYKSEPYVNRGRTHAGHMPDTYRTHAGHMPDIARHIVNFPAGHY